MACARCHDNKFDPITTEDFYGLAGIFFSSHILPNPGPKTNGPDMLRIPLASLVFLASLGAVAARAGGANPWVGAWRVSFWGALAMAVTAGVGAAFGAVA